MTLHLHRGDVAGYELVRVSTALLAELLGHDSPPIVVVGIDRQDDGTCELVVRRAFRETTLATSGGKP